jgi:hypothetical protein
MNLDSDVTANAISGLVVLAKYNKDPTRDL